MPDILSDDRLASLTRLVTFDAGEGPRHGVLLPSTATTEVLDLFGALTALELQEGRPATPEQVAARYGGDMLGLIERADVALPAVREVLRRVAASSPPDQSFGQPFGQPLGQRFRHRLGDVRLLAPVPRPLSMRDGYAFRQHVEAARRNRGLPMIPEFDKFPVFYYTNHLSVVGPGPVRVRRGHLDRLDFELEVAVVLGRSGRDLGIEEADQAIFGLMVMNDWSARTMQMEEMKLNLGPAKGKDFATSLGPYLVPREDLAFARKRTGRGEVFTLRMSAEVNGTPVAEGNVADMSWTFAELICRASYGVRLHPGEVIGSGTVGTGCFLETNGSGIYKDWWLKPGDRVVCEVEGLGRLENEIVLAEPEARTGTGPGRTP